MKKLLLTTALVLCITNPAMADRAPHAGSADARVKTLTYHSSDVYTITAHYGFSTVIEFARGENIDAISLGDSEAWQIVNPPQGNLLFIKPLLDNANTNMTVITDQHIYTFELSARKAQSHKSKRLSFRIKFQYPELMDIELANIGKSKNNGFASKEFTPSSVPAEEWNFNYSYAGSKRLRPTRAFDDGVFTYFQFSKNSAAPAVFSVDENGNESIVNYSMRGKYLVVETLARQFTLRNGNTSTCIFNDDYPALESELSDSAINRMEERTSINVKTAYYSYND